MSASLIGRLGVKRFQAIHQCSVPPGSRFSSELAPGPFHQGSEDEAEQSIQRPSRQATAGSKHALTDSACRPIAFMLTGGQVAACTAGADQFAEAGSIRSGCSTCAAPGIVQT